MDLCVFCEIAQGKAEATIVYEDEVCVAVMDIRPVNPGHVLVIPKAHAAYLNDLEEDIGVHLFKVAMSINKALRKSGLGCEGVNLFLADGETAGQEILHVHLRVFPRFVNDGFRLTLAPHY